MTSGPRFPRRTMLVGGLVAGKLLVHRGPEALGSAAAPTATRHLGADVTSTVADLTTRWQHVEPRVTHLGLWHDLLAGWLFDEGSGYAFSDVSDNGCALYVTGSAWNTTESGLAGAIHRAGFRGSAVHLNGTRRLEASPTALLAPDNRGYSVTGWVSLGALPSHEATLISAGPHALLSVQSDGHVSWAVTTADGKQHVARSRVKLADQVWTYVAATLNPGAGTLDLVVDRAVSAHLNVGRFAMPAPAAVSLILGRGLDGMLDQASLHRGALSLAAMRQIRLLGLPRVFTQTSESIDAARQVFTHFKGSDPVPHPILGTTVMSLRFPDSLTSVQGQAPLHAVEAVFVPAAFGCGWRATTEAAMYASRLSGPSGTFETWYCAVPDPSDPRRRLRKVVFAATARTSRQALVLSTVDGHWRVDLTDPSGHVTSAVGLPQDFPTQTLAHVALSWGAGQDGQLGVTLLADGRPVAFVAAEAGGTTFDGTVSLGGTRSAPAYCTFVDARLSDVVLAWGDCCPRGQAATDAAGLDLRDFFQRAPGTAPLWWRPGVGTGRTWTVARRAWQVPQRVGDDPDANLAVWQNQPDGIRSLFHPDAYGQASSIEAGVAVEDITDGWAGVFVQSEGQDLAFSGVTFMVNPSRNLLRLARYTNGGVVAQKSLPYDFTLRATTTYDITLTCAEGAPVRGFVDNANVISMPREADWPTSGFAGLVTDGTAALFSALHFSALTPATGDSRVIQTRAISYGQGATSKSLVLMPFCWRKRRGLLPWEYRTENPEPPGNIAGAETDLPPRPIPSATWRSEDSANSDLVVVNGTLWLILRGNPRIGASWGKARIGMLNKPVGSFDGVHFVDPNQHTGRTSGGGLLLTAGGSDDPNLNSPATAYVGQGMLLFLGRESGTAPGVGETVYAHFDLTKGQWVSPESQPVDWSDDLPLNKRLHSSPEIISLRDATSDEFQAVVFQQVGLDGGAFMATALVDNVLGVPRLAAEMPVHSFIQRPNKGAIYGFRVMFDNGIYYLHYNDGPTVPDWPDHFVLAAAVDPYAGPWVTNADSARDGSTYFRRGRMDEPDNGAIWQGTMFKVRGHYYMYYENYHSIGDVDLPYANYGNMQAGSRVGFATA